MVQTFDVDDKEFIEEMAMWTYKTGKYPLELVTFLSAVGGEKLIAIPTYSDVDCYLYLNKKAYKNYQTALTKVGALMDKMDYPKVLNQHKAGSPLSCPEFSAGFGASESDENPYLLDTYEYKEWEKGREFRVLSNAASKERIEVVNS